MHQRWLHQVEKNVICLHSPFASSQIMQNDCEGKLCYSPLGESIVDASMLTSVGFFSPLWWITWLLCPNWRFPSIVNPPSIMKGLGLSYLASVTWYGLGTSVVPLEVACGEGPTAETWGSASRGSSLQSSLGGEKLEDSSICHYFARVKFYWGERSEFSSTRFLQFLGTATFLMCSTVEKVSLHTTW